jgi:hypothetical protein
MKRTKSWFFIGLCTIVLLAAGIDQPEAAAGGAPAGRSGADSHLTGMASEIATPDLIERAFVRKDIDADKRLLYLAYAVYDYKSLPENYRSNVPWWGTEVVREIKDAAWKKAISSRILSPVESEFLSLLSPEDATVCDQQNGGNDVNSTHFRVNYGTILGGLSVGDYTVSLETTYTTEVTNYEWAAPPYTGDNPWNLYPVQIYSLGSSLYGYVTNSGGSYTGYIGNNPNTPQTETDAYASCMVLNSNYSGFPTGALGSLQATAAHEFVHSIQFGIGEQLYQDDIWWESIATYMEDEVFDSVNDNYYYLWPNFNTCLGQYSTSPYANWLFFRYAAEHNGGVNIAGGGEDVAQNFWTYVSSQGETGLQAYNHALGDKGANLADVFHDYAIATFFQQSCPTASPYCYEEAAGYLAEAGTFTAHGSIAAVPGSYSGTVPNNYGQNWVSLPVSGPMTITLQNQSSSGALRGSIVAQTASGLDVTAFPAVVNGVGSTTLAGYSLPAGATRLVAVITNQLQTANNPSSCSNTPYTINILQHPIEYDYYTYFPLVARAGSGMQGRVTYQGSPVSGTEVMLRYYNGSSWSTYATTETDSSGDYVFEDYPDLTSGAYKYVRWDNNAGDDSLLWTWRCDYIDYASDLTGSGYTCNFDVEDITLLSPSHNVTVSLPRTFSWQKRWSTTDSYSLELFDDNDEDPNWTSAPQGYVSSYTLESLPSGFSPYTRYGWDARVYGSNGYGVCYYYQWITFSNSGLSLAPFSIALSRNSALDGNGRQMLDEGP